MRGSTVLVLCVVVAGCSGPSELDETATAPAGAVITEYITDGLPLPALLLWREPYTEILVEVDYAEGRKPADATMDAFVVELSELTQKPVKLAGPDAIPGLTPASFGRRSTEDLWALHRDTFESDPDPAVVGRGTTAYLHVLFPDGVHESAFAGLSMGLVFVVFKDGMPTERASEALWGARGERIVLRHELGHTLGLVNCGLPMLTPREGDPCHSTNKRSVMYAGRAHESAGSTIDSLRYYMEHQEFPEPTFDQADLLDISSFRPHEPAKRLA